MLQLPNGDELMLYKCCECGRIFEESEIETWKESRGEFWGQPAYEDMSGCPYCFSTAYEEYDESEESEDEEDDESDS